MRQTFRFLAAAAVAAIAAGELAAQTITTFANDAAGSAWQAANGFTKRFGATVRAGNGQLDGDWEMALVGPDGTPIGTPAQVAWDGAAASHGYFLGMDEFGATLFTLDFGLPTDPFLEADVVPGGINTLIARLRSAGGSSSAELLPFQIIFQQGGSLTIPAIIGDPDAEWVVIQDARLAGGFSIAANEDFDAAGARFTRGTATGDQTLYQFRVGATNVVPEPATVALLGAGLAGLGVVARRRRPAVPT